MNMKKIVALVLAIIAALGMFTTVNAEADFELVKNMSMTQVHNAIMSTESEAEYDYTDIDKKDFDELIDSINLSYDGEDDILLCINVMTVDGVYTIAWSPTNEKGYLYVSNMDSKGLGWHGAMSAIYGKYCSLPTHYICYAQGFDEPLTGSDEDIEDYITSMLAYGTILAMFQEA